MGLFHTVSEIVGDFSRKLPKKIHIHVYFAPPLTGFPLELGIGVGVRTRSSADADNALDANEAVPNK